MTQDRNKYQPYGLPAGACRTLQIGRAAACLARAPGVPTTRHGLGGNSRSTSVNHRSESSRIVAGGDRVPAEWIVLLQLARNAIVSGEAGERRDIAFGLEEVVSGQRDGSDVPRQLHLKDHKAGIAKTHLTRD
jgi:hypothetical protein